jgi:hypothetical protein
MLHRALSESTLPLFQVHTIFHFLRYRISGVLIYTFIHTTSVTVLHFCRAGTTQLPFLPGIRLIIKNQLPTNVVSMLLICYVISCSLYKGSEIGCILCCVLRNSSYVVVAVQCIGIIKMCTSFPGAGSIKISNKSAIWQ